MFVSDQVIFLQLQKTAGTHIAALLEQHLGGAVQGKHQPLDQDPGDRLVVGSVRNPWDWYVSLWAYGCGGEGELQGLLTGSHRRTATRLIGPAWRRPARWGPAVADLVAHTGRDPTFWRGCYGDPHDAEAFRRWLRALLAPQGKAFLGADYRRRPLAGFAGFYTYRFLKVFTPVSVWAAQANGLGHMADLAPFVARHAAVQIFVRMEHLEADLAAVFARLGRSEITAEVLAGARSNASRRDRAAAYYDTETRDLVAVQEAFLIDRFGYTVPVA